MERAFPLPQHRNILILKYVSCVCKYRGRQQVYAAAYLHKIAKRWPHCYGWFSSCWDFAASSGPLQRCCWYGVAATTRERRGFFHEILIWFFFLFSLNSFYKRILHYMCLRNVYYACCSHNIYFPYSDAEKIGTLMESCGMKQMK